MKGLLENNKLSIFIIIVSITAILALSFYSTNREKPKKTNYNYNIEKEKEIYSGAVSLDNIFNKLDISLKDEEINDFVASSSCYACMDTALVGAMFNEEISPEYKLIYTLNRATWQAFEIDEKTMSENYDYIVSVKRKTIEKLGKKIFKDFIIPKKLNKKYSYYGLKDLVCMEESCYYSYSTFGITGHVINGYESKIVDSNNGIKTAQAFYITYGTSIKENMELETLTADVTLSETIDSTPIAKYDSYVFKYETGPDTTNIFDEFSKYYQNIPTYEYYFDNNILSKVIKR